MRSFDFAPYYRSTVGFDRLFSMLDQVGGVEGRYRAYPPYNIARTGENTTIASRLRSPVLPPVISRSKQENTLDASEAISRPTTRRRAKGRALLRGIAARNL